MRSRFRKNPTTMQSDPSMQEGFAARWQAAPLWQKLAAAVGALVIVAELLPPSRAAGTDYEPAPAASAVERRDESAPERSSRIAGAIAEECGGPRNGIDLLALYPDWSDNAIVAASCGNVVIGMVANQVREAWGEPTHINKTTTRMGISEQWVYRDRNGYVYLDDGVVSTIRE